MTEFGEGVEAAIISAPRTFLNWLGGPVAYVAVVVFVWAFTLGFAYGFATHFRLPFVAPAVATPQQRAQITQEEKQVMEGQRKIDLNLQKIQVEVAARAAAQDG